MSGWFSWFTAQEATMISFLSHPTENYFAYHSIEIAPLQKHNLSADRDLLPTFPFLTLPGPGIKQWKAIPWCYADCYKGSEKKMGIR